MRIYEKSAGHDRLMKIRSFVIWKLNYLRRSVGLFRFYTQWQAPSLRRRRHARSRSHRVPTGTSQWVHFLVWLQVLSVPKTYAIHIHTHGWMCSFLLHTSARCLLRFIGKKLIVWCVRSLVLPKFDNQKCKFWTGFAAMKSLDALEVSWLLSGECSSVRMDGLSRNSCSLLCTRFICSSHWSLFSTNQRRLTVWLGSNSTNRLLFVPGIWTNRILQILVIKPLGSELVWYKDHGRLCFCWCGLILCVIYAYPFLSLCALLKFLLIMMVNDSLFSVVSEVIIIVH